MQGKGRATETRAEIVSMGGDEGGKWRHIRRRVSEGRGEMEDAKRGREIGCEYHWKRPAMSQAGLRRKRDPNPRRTCKHPPGLEATPKRVSEGVLRQHHHLEGHRNVVAGFQKKTLQ